MLNAKLECHLVGPHALSHEVSVFIYIGKHTQEDTYP